MKKMFAIVCMLGVLMTSAASVAAELSDQRCRELVAELQPGKDALWRTIPWRLSVLEATAIALEEDKPIFIWAMDGQPLGRT